MIARTVRRVASILLLCVAHVGYRLGHGVSGSTLGTGTSLSIRGGDVGGGYCGGSGRGVGRGRGGGGDAGLSGCGIVG